MIPALHELEAFLFRVVTANAEVERMESSGHLLARLDAHAVTADKGALGNFGIAAQTQARRMGEVYELLYCLENSVRELVQNTLVEYYGAEDWWTKGVTDPMRKGAEKRKADDLKARWHGPRGDSLINYLDFPQYGEIIVHQWALFEDLLGDSDWVVSYFSEMNRSRRALAHTGTLGESDVERMDLRVRDWLRVVG